MEKDFSPATTVLLSKKTRELKESEKLTINFGFFGAMVK